MSIVRAVRITRRRIICPGALPPNRPASREIDEILDEHVASSRGQVKSRDIRRRMDGIPLRERSLVSQQ